MPHLPSEVERPFCGSRGAQHATRIGSIADMTTKRKIDHDAARLSAATAAVLAQISPRDLCIVSLGRGTYQLRNGVYYMASESYPIPPVRHSVSSTPAARIARTSLAGAELTSNGRPRRTSKCCPSWSPRPQSNVTSWPVPHLTDPPHLWVAFVTAMIALAE